MHDMQEKLVKFAQGHTLLLVWIALMTTLTFLVSIAHYWSTT